MDGHRAHELLHAADPQGRAQPGACSHPRGRLLQKTEPAGDTESCWGEGCRNGDRLCCTAGGTVDRVAAVGDRTAGAPRTQVPRHPAVPLRHTVVPR